MKKLLSMLILCAAAGAASAQHVPIFTQGLLEVQGRTQMVTTLDNLDILAELQGSLQDADLHLQYHAVTVGGYYRVLPNLKLGAFYRLQGGARHDNDLTADFSTNQWDWASTFDRLESVLIADASPRFLLPFLPGQNWVFMLKSRVLYNTYNSQMSILARPELTYFLILDRVPVLNASLSYEMYFPLDFGSTLIYQSYPYVTLLWHATPEIGVELAGAYKTTVWSSSYSWVQAAGWDPYSTAVSSWVVSLGAVITLTY